MKHILVLVVLALSIVFLVFKKDKVSVLKEVTAQYTAEQVGNRFVDIDPSQLPITPRALAEPGVTTVVYFHDETCPGCRILDRNIADFLLTRPDVAVRKVAIKLDGNAYYSAIKNYQWPIYMSPTILIFDKNLNLIAADKKTDSSGQDLLEEWIEKELSQRQH